MYAMDSVVFGVVRDTLKYIANETEYDYDTMQQCLDTYLQTRGRCSKPNRKGEICMHDIVPGTLYCRKHNRTVKTFDKTQCSALNRNGIRCIRDTVPGETICGIHIGVNRRKERTKDQRTCIYYDENEDGTVQFCKNTNDTDQWCCQLHSHLNSLYSKTYGCMNIIEYENETSIKRNPIAELFCETRRVGMLEKQ